MWVGKTPSLSGEPADGAVGSGQADGQSLVPGQRWWGCSGHVGAVPAGAVDQTTVGLSLGHGGFSLVSGGENRQARY